MTSLTSKKKTRKHRNPRTETLEFTEPELEASETEELTEVPPPASDPKETDPKESPSVRAKTRKKASLVNPPEAKAFGDWMSQMTAAWRDSPATPSSPPSIPNHPGSLKLATFDGSVQWLEYEAYFDQYAKVHKWDDGQKAQYLSLSLRGPAQSILLSLKLTDSLPYDSIKKALEQYFCPPEKVYVYQAELQGRKLKPAEELNDLARDIRTKTRLAYPEADEKTL
jgi:hypothetical protein